MPAVVCRDAATHRRYRALYLQGGVSAGAMVSGLLVGSGVGLLVLLRMNRDWRDNLKTLSLLYIGGVLLGIAAGLLKLF